MSRTKIVGKDARCACGVMTARRAITDQGEIPECANCAERKARIKELEQRAASEAERLRARQAPLMCKDK